MPVFKTEGTVFPQNRLAKDGVVVVDVIFI